MLGLRDCVALDLTHPVLAQKATECFCQLSHLSSPFSASSIAARPLQQFCLERSHLCQDSVFCTQGERASQVSLESLTPSSEVPAAEILGRTDSVYTLGHTYTHTDAHTQTHTTAVLLENPHGGRVDTKDPVCSRPVLGPENLKLLLKGVFDQHCGLHVGNHISSCADSTVCPDSPGRERREEGRPPDCPDSSSVRCHPPVSVLGSPSPCLPRDPRDLLPLLCYS